MTENDLAMKLSKGEILDKYVMEFLKINGLNDSIQAIELSNELIKTVERILFLLDSNEVDMRELIFDLNRAFDWELYPFVKFLRSMNYKNAEKLIDVVLSWSANEKKWKNVEVNNGKIESEMRRTISKVLDAITEYQNYQTKDMDRIIDILREQYPKTNKDLKNQVFLSHAFVDQLYTLGLFLYFHVHNVYLYIDWMHQDKNSKTKKLKYNLIKEIKNSNQLLFLRSLNSELALQGGKRQIREWCAWEIGTFDYKSNSTYDKYFIDRYRRNKKSKSRSQLIQDFLPFKYIQNARLY